MENDTSARPVRRRATVGRPTAARPVPTRREGSATAADPGRDGKEHAGSTTVLLDRATGEPVVPGGSPGLRWGEAGRGRWSLELGDTERTEGRSTIAPGAGTDRRFRSDTICRAFLALTKKIRQDRHVLPAAHEEDAAALSALDSRRPVDAAEPSGSRVTPGIPTLRRAPHGDPA
mgnify:FL=1